jgi:hypothetical protein
MQKSPSSRGCANRPIDNEPLVFTNPRGIFRIPSNSMPWNEDIMKYTKLQFNSIEAL